MRRNGRESIFINNQRNDGRPEVIKFTRRDGRERNDLSSSQITNQKVTARSVECSISPFTNEFMICSFEDELETSKEIRNIVFTNFDAPKQKFTTYKQSDSGEVVTKVNFPTLAICEILGHNHIGLTMNCYGSDREKSKKNENDMRNRNQSIGGNYGL